MSAETAMQAAKVLYDAVQGVKSNKEKCVYVYKQVMLMVDNIKEEDAALGQHSLQISNFQVFE